MNRIFRLPPPCRRRLPWGLLGMIALVATTELIVARADRDLTTTTAVCWRDSGERVRLVRGSKIVCLGTSLVKTGILPWIIEERTGTQAVNLALYSGPIPASYYLLRQTLESGARPSVLIIDCQDLAATGRSREDWAEAFHFHTRLWAELLDVRDCLDLAWSARDPDFFVQTTLSWALPTWKARFEIRSAVLAALRGQSASARDDVKVIQRNWFMNRGAHVFPISYRWFT